MALQCNGLLLVGKRDGLLTNAVAWMRHLPMERSQTQKTATTEFHLRATSRKGTTIETEKKISGCWVFGLGWEWTANKCKRTFYVEESALTLECDKGCTAVQF